VADCINFSVFKFQLLRSFEEHSGEYSKYSILDIYVSKILYLSLLGRRI